MSTHTLYDSLYDFRLAFISNSFSMAISRTPNMEAVQPHHAAALVCVRALCFAQN